MVLLFSNRSRCMANASICVDVAHVVCLRCCIDFPGLSDWAVYRQIRAISEYWYLSGSFNGFFRSVGQPVSVHGQFRRLPKVGASFFFVRDFQNAFTRLLGWRLVCICTFSHSFPALFNRYAGATNADQAPNNIRIVINTPLVPSAMIIPAKSMPAKTERTVHLKSRSKKLAAKVPVHAPVPGIGMPTNKSNAINIPFPPFFNILSSLLRPFLMHQVKNFPI